MLLNRDVADTTAQIFRGAATDWITLKEIHTRTGNRKPTLKRKRSPRPLSTRKSGKTASSAEGDAVTAEANPDANAFSECRSEERVAVEPSGNYCSEIDDQAVREISTTTPPPSLHLARNDAAAESRGLATVRNTYESGSCGKGEAAESAHLEASATVPFVVRAQFVHDQGLTTGGKSVAHFSRENSLIFATNRAAVTHEAALSLINNSTQGPVVNEHEAAVVHAVFKIIPGNGSEITSDSEKRSAREVLPISHSDSHEETPRESSAACPGLGGDNAASERANLSPPEAVARAYIFSQHDAAKPVALAEWASKIEDG